MSEAAWGDEDDVDQPGDVDQVDELEHTFGVDLDAVLTELVPAGLSAAVHQHLAKIATRTAAEAVGPLAAALEARASEIADGLVARAARGSLDEDDAPALAYGSVDEFVREYLTQAYRRRIDGRHRVWSARWWESSEAVIRLEALWRSWEHLRQDPATGMSVWWRDHADHHMSVLLDPDGPFSGAEETTARGEPLPYEAPPTGMFDEAYTT